MGNPPPSQPPGLGGLGGSGGWEGAGQVAAVAGDGEGGEARPVHRVHVGRRAPGADGGGAAKSWVAIDSPFKRRVAWFRPDLCWFRIF